MSARRAVVGSALLALVVAAPTTAHADFVTPDNWERTRAAGRRLRELESRCSARQVAAPDEQCRRCDADRLNPGRCEHLFAREGYLLRCSTRVEGAPSSAERPPPGFDVEGDFRQDAWYEVWCRVRPPDEAEQAHEPEPEPLPRPQRRDRPPDCACRAGAASTPSTGTAIIVMLLLGLRGRGHRG